MKILLNDFDTSDMTANEFREVLEELLPHGPTEEIMEQTKEFVDTLE